MPISIPGGPMKVRILPVVALALSLALPALAEGEAERSDAWDSELTPIEQRRSEEFGLMVRDLRPHRFNLAVGIDYPLPMAELQYAFSRNFTVGLGYEALTGVNVIISNVNYYSFEPYA